MKKELKYVFSNGKAFDAVVVENEKSIGLTIVEKDNPDNYLVCLNGPLSPILKDRENKNQEIENYLKARKVAVQGIKKGILYAKDFDTSGAKCGSDISKNSCAFNQ